MKTARFFASLLLFALLAAACQKKYTCHCIYKTNGSSAYEQHRQITAKKKDAEKKCDQHEFSRYETVDDSTYLSTAECELRK